MDVIDQFNSGNKSSFETLFDQYFHRLCGFAFKYLEDGTKSEDAVQEAFISLWEKKGDFENVQTIKAYLYASVKNKCLNHLKHQAVVQKHESLIIQELENEAATNHSIIEEEVFGQLHSEISKLPPESKKIMILVLQGQKNREIAEVLGISENTVKTQKKIAYAKLKKSVHPVLYSIMILC